MNETRHTHTKATESQADERRKNVEEIFEPVLGELVADDAFAFTTLSCHC